MVSSHEVYDDPRASLLPSESFIDIDPTLLPSHSTIHRQTSNDSLLLHSNDDSPDQLQQTIFNIVYTRAYLIFFFFLFILQFALLVYALVKFILSHEKWTEPLWVIICDSIFVGFAVLDIFMRICASGASRFFITDKHRCFNILDLIVTFLSAGTLLFYIVKTELAFVTVISVVVRNLARGTRIVFLLMKHRRTRRIVRATERDIIDIPYDEYQYLKQMGHRVDDEPMRRQQREHVQEDDGEVQNISLIDHHSSIHGSANSASGSDDQSHLASNMNNNAYNTFTTIQQQRISLHHDGGGDRSPGSLLQSNPAPNLSNQLGQTGSFSLQPHPSTNPQHQQPDLTTAMLDDHHSIIGSDIDNGSYIQAHVLPMLGQLQSNHQPPQPMFGPGSSSGPLFASTQQQQLGWRPGSMHSNQGIQLPGSFNSQQQQQSLLDPRTTRLSFHQGGAF